MNEVTKRDSAPVSFLKEKHELTKLLKALDKASANAVKLLVDTMESTDDKIDLKTRLLCAEKLIAFYTATAKQVSDDDMARLIAEVKMGQSGIVLKPGESTAAATPALNFTDIKSV